MIKIAVGRRNILVGINKYTTYISKTIKKIGNIKSFQNMFRFKMLNLLFGFLSLIFVIPDFSPHKYPLKALKYMLLSNLCIERTVVVLRTLIGKSSVNFFCNFLIDIPSI